MTNRRKRPLIAISSCLFGDRVRYDGGHRRSDLILRELEPHVDWFPLCPEVGAGMGVPREPIEVVRDPSRPDGVRVVAVETGRDWTGPLSSWARDVIAVLHAAGVRGCILKSRSPSCGVGSTPWRDEAKQELGIGNGLFAAAFAAAFPDVPLVEDEDLDSPEACAQFLARVRA